MRQARLDERTGCAHYRSERDIVAIRFRCCGEYYACYACHEALADHPAQVWPVAEFGEKAILCGSCGAELSIREYLECDSRCRRCGAAFNPGCRSHHRLYFEGGQE